MQISWIIWFCCFIRTIPDFLENKPGISSNFSEIKLPCSTNNKLLSQFNLYTSSGNQIIESKCTVNGFLNIQFSSAKNSSKLEILAGVLICFK